MHAKGFKIARKETTCCPNSRPLDVKEAAAHLKVLVLRLYTLSANRWITSIKSHKKVLFLKSDLEQWLLRNRRLSEKQIEVKFRLFNKETKNLN